MNSNTRTPAETAARADFDAAWEEATDATANATARDTRGDLNADFDKANKIQDTAARFTAKAKALRDYAARIRPTK